jgi:glycosyltransferase involved in cell wall biosynthesis
VVPALNESPNIVPLVTRILAAFPQSEWDVEIVLVDDGSTDATGEVARRLALEEGIRALRHAANRGKGAAVRTGVLETRGDRVLVCDADGSTPPGMLPAFDRALRDGADVVVGDRRSPGARVGRPQRPLRRVLGSGYVLLARLVSGIPLRDYNCGFKLFRGGAARVLLGSCRSERWAWDVEVLAEAVRRGLTVRALPVEWSQGPTTQVRPLRDVFRSLGELASLWWRSRGRPRVERGGVR